MNPVRKYGAYVALIAVALAAVASYGWMRRSERERGRAGREAGADLIGLNGALAMGDVDQARIILRAHPEYRFRSDWLATPTVQRDVRTLQFLLDLGWDPDGLNDDGNPVLTCGRTGNMRAARCLLNGGASVIVRSKDGFTPLMRAAREGLSSLCALLIAHGADVNATVDPGASQAGPGVKEWQEDRTALQMAVRYNHVGVVEVLLAHGANTKIKTRLQETPLSLARALGHDECELLLLKIR
jgi:ankyrin repeat protein